MQSPAGAYKKVAKQIAEPRELGMVPVSLRRTAEHGPRQEPFPPQGEQPLRVQIGWIKAPETHAPHSVGSSTHFRVRVALHFA